jgi:hypothetical protein
MGGAAAEGSTILRPKQELVTALGAGVGRVLAVNYAVNHHVAARVRLGVRAGMHPVNDGVVGRGRVRARGSIRGDVVTAGFHLLASAEGGNCAEVFVEDYFEGVAGLVAERDFEMMVAAMVRVHLKDWAHYVAASLKAVTGGAFPLNDLVVVHGDVRAAVFTIGSRIGQCIYRDESEKDVPKLRHRTPKNFKVCANNSFVGAP